MARNEFTGDPGVGVQAGVLHGGVHVATSGESGRRIPRQLPMAVPGFINREAELAELDALAPRGAGGEERGAVVVSAVAGTAGVGKTALAVHWAHRMRGRYVDGDLYIDMRGYGPGPRVEVAHALEALLRCLQVPAEQIPDDAAGRAALYRSVLAGRKVLILIDNAASPEQVRPLLPGSAECLALVTSRSALPGLVARGRCLRKEEGTIDDRRLRTT